MMEAPWFSDGARAKRAALSITTLAQGFLKMALSKPASERNEGRKNSARSEWPTPAVAVEWSSILEGVVDGVGVELGVLGCGEFAEVCLAEMLVAHDAALFFDVRGSDAGAVWGAGTARRNQEMSARVHSS
ncbi:MAG: hypothetical protein FJW31_13875 [Acidobacteria bacterium]|nr:hypothetical protein [Acidobacteriota bacterium]